MTKLKFEELSLSEEIISAVKDMGFEEASPIQSAAIPLILEKKDIVGQAQTGTGKTAAFAIPVIEKIDSSLREVQALILCPTRELVIQVAEEFRKLMKYKSHLSAVPIYGGQPIDRQLRALKNKPQIIIGTPGRTMDHMKRGSLDISSVKIIVLDEADEMLDMGFRDDIEFMLKDTPEDRQTVMFSATMAKEILELTKKYQKDSTVVNVMHTKLSKPKIQQIYFEVLEKNKPELLARLIDLHNVKLALVFCNTKSQVDHLVDVLKSRGYFADALHGDMSQTYRDKVMNGFRNGSVEILVATDVAGRGIDVSDVEAVFNYDLPRDDEDYIHRIGRTGRAGKNGIAFTFIVGKQIYNLKRIERMNGMQITRQNVPTMDELEATRISFYADKISNIIKEGHMSKYINQVETLMAEDITSIDVAAALLKLTLEKENEGFDHSVDLSASASLREERRPSGNRNFGNRDGSRRPDFKRDNFRRDSNRDGTRRPEFKRDDAPRDGARRPEFKREDAPRDGFRKPEFKRDDAPRDGARRPEFKREDAPRDGFRKDDFRKDVKPFKKKVTGKKETFGSSEPSKFKKSNSDRKKGFDTPRKTK